MRLRVFRALQALRAEKITLSAIWLSSGVCARSVRYVRPCGPIHI
jgi:2-methylisocitrate lyase-like PEP mutase family enzyme